VLDRTLREVVEEYAQLSKPLRAETVVESVALSAADGSITRDTPGGGQQNLRGKQAVRAAGRLSLGVTTHSWSIRFTHSSMSRQLTTPARPYRKSEASGYRCLAFASVAGTLACRQVTFNLQADERGTWRAR